MQQYILAQFTLCLFLRLNLNCESSYLQTQAIYFLQFIFSSYELLLCWIVCHVCKLFHWNNFFFRASKSMAMKLDWDFHWFEPFLVCKSCWLWPAFRVTAWQQPPLASPLKLPVYCPLSQNERPRSYLYQYCEFGWPWPSYKITLTLNSKTFKHSVVYKNLKRLKLLI